MLNSILLFLGDMLNFILLFLGGHAELHPVVLGGHAELYPVLLGGHTELHPVVLGGHLAPNPVHLGGHPAHQPVFSGGHFAPHPFLLGGHPSPHPVLLGGRPCSPSCSYGGGESRGGTLLPVPTLFSLGETLLPTLFFLGDTLHPQPKRTGVLEWRMMGAHNWSNLYIEARKEPWGKILTSVAVQFVSHWDPICHSNESIHNLCYFPIGIFKLREANLESDTSRFLFNNLLYKWFISFWDLQVQNISGLSGHLKYYWFLFAQSG